MVGDGRVEREEVEMTEGGRKEDVRIRKEGERKPRLRNFKKMIKDTRCNSKTCRPPDDNRQESTTPV